MTVATNVNQWKNTHGVIDWFNRITDKNRSSFFQFDIENFYPSILLQLFNEAIQYAKLHTEISNDDMSIIMHARKSLLFHDKIPWEKRNNADDFDVPMGSYDGGEVCELIGIFLLHKLGDIVNQNNLGLYRDDGLGIMKRVGRPEIERRKKKIVQLFKVYQLNITIQTNLQTVNFLDVQLDLKSNIFKPYLKPNNEPVYINVKSNHPPNVIKQIPAGLSKRLSEISSNEEVFNSVIPVYEQALRNSGFTESLQYVQSESQPVNREEKQEKRNRKRKIIWFNPPYSLNVKTYIGKTFLKLISTHFHKQHVLHKIFNRNTVKVSYSCTKNISTVISNHNLNLMCNNNVQRQTCNCRVKGNCPLENKCLSSNIVYGAWVNNVTDNEENDYLGLSKPPFKERLGNHIKSFNNCRYINDTELAKHIWALKNNGKVYSIKWRIVQEVHGKLVSGMCRLCLTEKLEIIDYPNKEILLNSNCIQKCRHENEYLLSNFAKCNDSMD